MNNYYNEIRIDRIHLCESMENYEIMCNELEKKVYKKSIKEKLYSWFINVLVAIYFFISIVVLVLCFLAVYNLPSK